jgi:hypothetical protein
MFFKIRIFKAILFDPRALASTFGIDGNRGAD